MDDTGIDVNDLIMAFRSRAEAVAHNQECFAKMMGLRPEPHAVVVAKCQLHFLRVAPIDMYFFCDNGQGVFTMRYNSKLLKGEGIDG